MIRHCATPMGDDFYSKAQEELKIVIKYAREQTSKLLRLSAIAFHSEGFSKSVRLKEPQTEGDCTRRNLPASRQNRYSCPILRQRRFVAAFIFSQPMRQSPSERSKIHLLRSIFHNDRSVRAPSCNQPLFLAREFLWSVACITLRPNASNDRARDRRRRSLPSTTE